VQPRGGLKRLASRERSRCMRRREVRPRSSETWKTSYVSTFPPFSTVNNVQGLSHSAAAATATAMPSIPEDAWAAVPDGDSSTSKGIVIGILSAFGSAAIVAFILFIIWFFQYTQRGRIFLDRLGRPGEYDDEQAFAKEEAEALEEMDDMQRMEYLRAKGAILGQSTKVRAEQSILTVCSLHTSEPSRVRPDGYFTFSVSRNTRKRCFSMGVRTGVGDCELLRRRSYRD
jgi:hypothetical protein